MSRRTNAAFAALVALAGIAAALAPRSASAAGPKPPKQLCIVWMNGADAGDTWEMNLLVRAVPGKIAAKFADQTPAVLRFYELDGMAAVPRGALFPNLHGT
ncbi:MAG TPA: hypothetical protein VNE71_09140, partial [Myxococcota bacterium]|nr:hypothetical protein [Myxococcota bacterium]